MAARVPIPETHASRYWFGLQLIPFFYRMPIGPKEIPEKTEVASNFLLLVVSNIYVHIRKFSDFATIQYKAKTESEPRIVSTLEPKKVHELVFLRLLIALAYII